MHVPVLANICPVEPTGLIVLAVGIVVTLLRVAHFVAHQNHWYAKREYRDRQEVFHLPVSQLFYCAIIARALNSAIPAAVVIHAIAIAFAIRFVVFVVIGNEVVEGKSVMTGYEVDALLRLPSLVTIDFRAADQAVSQTSH